MGLAEAIDGICGLIDAITPTLDAALPFWRQDEADRRPFNDAAGERTRLYEVAFGPAMQSPFTDDSTMTHARHFGVIRRAYRREDWRREHEFAAARAADDVSIVSALRPPNGWSGFAHMLVIAAGETAAEDTGLVVFHETPLILDLEV